MSAFGSLALQILLMILLGVVLKKTHVIEEETQKGLSRLLLAAILPISILHSSLEDVGHPTLVQLCISLVFMIAYYVLAILISRRISRFEAKEERLAKLYVNLCVFANTGFIGFSLSEALFGSGVTIYVVLYNLVYQIFLALYAIRMLTGRTGFRLSDLLRDPVNAASIAAVILFFIPVRLPAPVMDMMESVGGMVVPLSMMIIGGQLAQVRLRELFTCRLVWSVSLLRLVVFPLLMLLACRLFRLDTTMTQALVLVTGLPSGSLNSILAEKYNCYPREAAFCVVGSTFLLAVSLPLLLSVMQMVL